MQIVSPKFSFTFLRIAFGIIFIWFGILKVFNSSPVTPLINSVSPISFPWEIPLIGVFEVALGALFFANKFIKITSLVTVLYLIVVSLLVIVGKGFSPWFPLLTLEGEFVVKNLVLIAGGLLLASEKKEEKSKTS